MAALGHRGDAPPSGAGAAAVLSLRHARRNPWADAVHAFGARPQFDTEGISCELSVRLCGLSN
jgi:hypothetical protein